MTTCSFSTTLSAFLGAFLTTALTTSMMFHYSITKHFILIYFFIIPYKKYKTYITNNKTINKLNNFIVLQYIELSLASQLIVVPKKPNMPEFPIPPLLVVGEPLDNLAFAIYNTKLF